MTTEDAIKLLEYPLYKWSMDCDERDDGLSYTEVIELAIDALRAQQEAEKNDPLTLDELREMDGEPVWVKTLCDEEQSGWWIAELDGGDPYKDNYVYSCDLYGKTWLAYRRKPEEG